MDQMNILLAHMQDIAGKAVRAGSAASRFLTPAEAQSIERQFKHNRDVALTFDGGIDGAERVRAVFTNPDWGSFDKVDLFAALRIVWKAQETLTHRDILGALMALGVERATMGDIICEDSSATLICLPEMSGYIAGSLTKAGRIRVDTTVVSLDDLPARREDLAIKTATVASLRLDVIMCAAFGLSRTKALEFLAAGRVNLNHVQCMQPAKEAHEGAVVSVRGLGRVKLLGVGGTSRKGRIFIQLGIYAR